MPRRKKKVAETTESQRLEKENQILKVKKMENSFIVISDSDEEPGEENGLLRTRTMQQSDRAKCAAKRKITQMTEDEQFALALKMSEQEAQQVNDQVEEEEELLRKAIAESLNSCQPLDSSATSSAPLSTEIPAQYHQEKPVVSETTESLFPCPESPHSSVTSLSQGPHFELTEMPKSPLVMLKRLSQEIVESSLLSSIILSQEKSQPSLKSSEVPSSPVLSDSSDNSSSPPGKKQFVLSPTFSRVPVGTWQLVPRKLFANSCVSQEEEVEGREKCLDHSGNLEMKPITGSSGTGDKSSQPMLESKNSNFFDSGTSQWAEDTKYKQPEKKSRLGCGSLVATQGKEKAAQLCLPSTIDVKSLQEEIGGTVHYYWGIPFCPVGVDPNQYTKVILCQLEVYQKSLKLAQRQLFQKKDFGEPILPSSYSLLQKEDHDEREEPQGVNEAITKEMGNNTETRRESKSSTLRQKSKNLHRNPLQSLKEKPLLEDEPTTSHHQNSQVLFAEDTPEEDEVMGITSSPTALSLLTSKRSPVIARGSSAEEITVCPETQLSPSEVPELEREEECLSPKESPVKAAVNENIEKEMSASIFSAHIQVSCPMCDQGFPPTEIELHAMYCNGLVGEESRHSPVLTRKRKRAKCKSDNERDIQPSLDIDKSEKCYLCKSLVPFKEYPSHVDFCLQIATDDQGNKLERDDGQPSDFEGKGVRQRNTREGSGNGGRLLSLLEQSEYKSAETDTKTESSEGEAFRYLPSEMEKADGSRGDQSSFNSDDSPIKAFVSISEAKDCLVDFKKQLSVRPGGRKRTKASRGKRRKS
ncbi:BRCA1-A complex subunit RAP80 [Trichosurus vulpecula]|uniref:BRCA1-A complex subunit RAP80 n=1 Tax=Trichosurus vulpecula TaxID=9337 RepID=UPI00186B225C|nr:BRCA1-A complex subunit RAP80 [Trichosurus vulpecula]